MVNRGALFSMTLLRGDESSEFGHDSDGDT
jgi:hypothetical protein